MVHEIRVKARREALDKFNDEELLIKLYNEGIIINNQGYYFGTASIIEPDFSNLETNYLILINDELRIESIKQIAKPLKDFDKDNLIIIDEEINEQHDYLIRLFYRMHLPKDWKPEKSITEPAVTDSLDYYLKIFKR